MSALDDGETAFHFDDVLMEPTAPRSLHTISASSLAHREVPSRPWLVKDLIPDHQVTLLAGDGGTGKSLLATQLAVAVAGAGHWLGTRPVPGVALFVSAEDERDEVHRRLVDIAAGAGMSLEALSDFRLLPLAGKAAVLASPRGQGDLLRTTPLWDALVDTIRELRPRLLVLDNLADVFAGNENSRSQARQFIGLLRGLAIEHQLAVVLISHPSLTGLSSGSGTSGSTAWSNSVRARLYLDRARAENGEEPDPNLRVLRLLKANYAPAGVEVRLRWSDGRFRTDGGGAGAFNRAAAEQKAEAKFLELLRLMGQQGRTVSPNTGTSYAPAMFAKHPEANGFRSRAFAVAMERLLSVERIKVVAFGPPSKQRFKLVEAGDTEA